MSAQQGLQSGGLVYSLLVSFVSKVIYSFVATSLGVNGDALLPLIHLLIQKKTIFLCCSPLVLKNVQGHVVYIKLIFMKTR